MTGPEQATAQPRTLSGTLAKTPMPRLLISASGARVTGSLELTSPEAGQSATIVMVRGLVTKVRTSAPVAYLGAVLYELGYIDTEALNDSLRELSRTKWLHGEILLTREAVSQVQLVEGLQEQTTRKLVHLFTLPPSTTYAFEAEADRLEAWGGGDFPHVDPSVAVWRGVREGFAEEDIDAAFARLSKNAFRLVAPADPKKFDMNDLETTAVECLRARALTTDELAGRASIDPRRAREILYFLLVTKQAESIDTSGVRPAYRAPVEDPAASRTKPTRPEMPAVGSSPRISIARQPTESAQWRAVGPRPSYSSAKIPVGEVRAPDSSRVPVAGGAPPSIPSSIPPRSSGSRITASVLATAAAAATSSVPPRPAGSTPAGKMDRTEPPSATRMRTTPFPGHASSGQFSSKVVAELASRRQSIFERARAILKEDYFQRLSLPRDAGTTQVEEAFVALRTLWDTELLPPALEEARNDCTFVLSCLVEAYTTLRDPRKREEYARALSTAQLRAPADELEADLAATGTTDPYEGARTAFARGDFDRAERLARRATKADPDAAEPLALFAWIEASKPTNASPEETKRRIVMLDRALRANENLAQAYYWRGLLHKRIESHSAAMANFRKTVELNPKHMDAVRELRVYEMRIRRNSITMKAVK